MSLLESRLLAGDALAQLRSLPSGVGNLVVSSPPYNIGKEYETRRSLKDYLSEQELVLAECHRILAPTGSLFWQVGAYTPPGEHVPLDVKVFPILEKLGMKPRNRIVWIRPHGVHARNRFSCRYETMLWFSKGDDYRFDLEPIRVPQKYPNKKFWKGDKHGQLSCDPVGKNPGDVWAFRNVKHNHEEQTIHPCQFPEDLIERIVLSTTLPGDLVIDPYVGSGTVAVVAKRLARRWVGIDVDEEYLRVAKGRLSGEPDHNGVFPNLKSLRDYAERNQLEAASSLRFERQTGAMATPRAKAKIVPEQLHLQNLLQETEWEAENSAYRRAAAVGKTR